jgi:type IX secretion system PorP/SprF family membrane protein
MVLKVFSNYWFFFAIIYSTSWCYGQDIHWSQFNDNPLFQNPGYAGHFNGDYRFVGNYRNQWKSVTIPFSTLSFSSDSKLYKHPEIGYGLLFFHDISGDGKFRTVEVQFNGSYLIKLTKDSVHSLRPGINFGMNHRQINWNQLYFDNQFNGAIFDPTLPTGEAFQTDRRTNFSIGAGTVYEYFKSKRNKYTVGLGFYNLNRPDQGFYGEKVSRDIRFNLSGRGLFKLDIDWDLVPGFNFSIQGKYRELMFGSSLKYTLIERLGIYRAVYAGLWYRNRDAACLSVGMDYQSWFAGISYDINLSKLLPASNARGGIEFAIRYILNHFKPSKSLHRVCPDYI